MSGYRRIKPLAPTSVYYGRLLKVAGIGVVVIGAALGVGTVGYHVTADLPWIDALLNASMILTGMGPVDKMGTSGAKLFATAYAIIASVVFVSTATLMLIPVFQRTLHRYHLDTFTDEEEKEEAQKDQATAKSGPPEKRGRSS